MFAISFGNLCFNRSADREQGIEFVIAPKQNYQSLDHFVDAVFEFMKDCVWIEITERKLVGGTDA
jgi:hypothetical protein